MAAFMYRGRSLKSRRLKGRGDGSDEQVTLDYSRDASCNFRETVYAVINNNKIISKAKRLGYYNALVRLCYRFGANYDIGISTEELFACLRCDLVHEEKEIRVGCLRALRYLCHNEQCIDAMLNLNMDCLVARSLDISIDNELERIHALRLVKKMIQVSPKKFPQSLVSVLVSIANNGKEERDKLHRTCLALLCELSFSSPCLVCRRGGLAAILSNMLQSHSFPKLNESLLTTVLYLLNHPSTRHFIPEDIGIEQLLAPFTECHFKQSQEAQENPLGKDTTNNKYTACKMAISTLMKSWPGLMRLCKPDGTGLQSLIGVLYLPYHETRKEVLDLLFDIFRLQVPEWTDDFTRALVSVDPAEMRDSWKISEGFVAEEGACLLTPIAQTRVNFADSHNALILAAFVTAGLLEALVEVITDADTKVSIRATILLGQLLHMANCFVPIECGFHSHCLPTLIDTASSFHNPKRNAASLAVKYLDRLHSLKKRGPVACSLFLDQLIRRARTRSENRLARPLSSNRSTVALLDKPAAWHTRPRKMSTFEKLASTATTVTSNEVEHDVSQAVKDSQVLATKEHQEWDWQLITAILKWPDDAMKKLEDQGNLRFVKRMLYYYKPDSKLFSTLELSNPMSKKIANCGQHLLLFLINCDNDESRRFLKEWLGNVGSCLEEIKSQRAPPDALLSAHRVINTCAQYYFLLLGLLSGSAQGDSLLDNMGIYQHLLELVSTTTHDNYVKLIVSSLAYVKDGQPRIILAKALKAAPDNARVYCVSLLRVLMRARVLFFQQWGVELLVLALYDPHRPVSQEAFAVLSEACDDEAHLQQVVRQRPNVAQLGVGGAQLLARLMGCRAGFAQLRDSSVLLQHLDRWHSRLCSEYVTLVEEALYEANTTYEKSYDGSCIRRSNRCKSKKPVFAPVHIYGQLVQHQDGFHLLKQQGRVEEYAETLRTHPTRTEADLLVVKEALWAIGHTGTSALGIEYLQELGSVPDVIKIAEESAVYSLRGTAFYVLGLLSCTCKGADLLDAFGWQSVRHKATDKWPVLDDPATNPGNTPPAPLTPTTHHRSLDSPSGGLPTAWSGASLASSDGLLLPAVTVNVNTKPDGEARANPSSPQAINCGPERSVSAGSGTPGTEGACSPLFHLGSLEESLSSSYKSRSNTVNTLETLSEDERDGVDDGDGVDGNATVGDRAERSRSRSMVVKVQIEKTAFDEAFTKDGSKQTHFIINSDKPGFEHVCLVNENHVSEQTEEGEGGSSEYHQSNQETDLSQGNKLQQLDPVYKNRSLSTPLDCDNKPEIIHPRTTSDPRGMSETRLDGQAAVHFKDPDLVARRYDPAILRRKAPDSGSTGDAGVFSGGESQGPGNTRAGSHDSYKTAQDHTNLSNSTDTSGVGSYGSSFPNHVDKTFGLSPIPSTGSMQTDPTGSNGRVEMTGLSLPSAHPCDQLRHQANLRRVPSTKRRFSNPVLTPILRTLQRDSALVSEYGISFASSRDISGYATLRELKRQTRAAEVAEHSRGKPGAATESRMRTLFLGDSTGNASNSNKAHTLELRALSKFRQSVRKILRRNKSQRDSAPVQHAGSGERSATSLQEMDNSPGNGRGRLPSFYSLLDSDLRASVAAGTGGNLSPSSSGATGLQRIPTIPNIRKPKPASTGRPEFLGVALPVDVTMVFQDTDEEDMRAHRPLRERVDRRSKSALVTRSSSSDDGLEHHCAEICLVCYKPRSSYSTDSDTDESCVEAESAQRRPIGSPDNSPPEGVDVERRPRCGGDFKARLSSLSELVDSMATQNSRGTGAGLSEDTHEGRVLVRKEILRLVVNCSSSVSTDSTEQALLILKQKFWETFQDVCLYSEISFLLATYNYRLKARRFIQELFQDMSFAKLRDVVDDIAEKLASTLEPNRAEREDDDEHDRGGSPLSESLQEGEEPAENSTEA